MLSYKEKRIIVTELSIASRENGVTVREKIENSYCMVSLKQSEVLKYGTYKKYIENKTEKIHKSIYASYYFSRKFKSTSAIYLELSGLAEILTQDPCSLKALFGY